MNLKQLSLTVFAAILLFGIPSAGSNTFSLSEITIAGNEKTSKDVIITELGLKKKKRVTNNLKERLMANQFGILQFHTEL